MDTLTQGLLGAAVGQAGFGRTLGKRAVFWGGVGGLMPDLDILASAAGPTGEWLYHRGPSHALWVGPVVGPAIGYAVWRLLRRRGDPGPLGAWIGLFVAALFTHPLLDIFTTYGTQLLAPFSDRRFAFNSVGIIDPTYSTLLLVALVVGSRWGPGSSPARWAAWLALVLSSLYLLLGLQLNATARARAESQLEAQGIRGARVQAYPTLFQLQVRRVVVHHEGRIRVGWFNLRNGRAIEWAIIPKTEHPLIETLRSLPEGRVFEWFAMGQTRGRVFEEGSTTIVEIDDLRYGFPTRPELGIWGIRARFDAQGRQLGEVERVRRRLPLPAGELLGQLLRFAFE
jgi:inner membrane protein